MTGFFKMSNDIFEYKLSPKAFIVYAYMCCKVNKFGTLIAKCDTIGEACNMCRQSVMTAIAELESQQLVIKNNRYNHLGYKASAFSIKNIVVSKGWFRVERELFATDINPTDFLIYAFIKKCMFNSTSEAFPSLNYITEHTYISHRRVCTAIKYLRQYTFINRVKRIRRDLSFNRNRYLHFSLNTKGKRYTVKQCTSLCIRELIANHFDKSLKYMLPQLVADCNTFSSKGVVQNFNNTS